MGHAFWIRLIFALYPVATIFALALTATLEAVAEAFAVLFEAFRFATLAPDAMNLS